MGIRPTNHTDFNVVPIDHMMVIWSAVTRKSRSGEVIGPDERISPLLQGRVSVQAANNMPRPALRAAAAAPSRRKGGSP